MAKKKQSKPALHTSHKALLAIIGILLILLLIVSIGYFKQTAESQQHTATNPAQTGSIASIGAMQYDFSSGKAVKRTDETVAKLKAFLVAEGNKSVGPNCPTVYHNVIVASPDETQVLLAYGCGDPGSTRCEGGDAPDGSAPGARAKRQLTGRRWGRGPRWRPRVPGGCA